MLGVCTCLGTRQLSVAKVTGWTRVERQIGARSQELRGQWVETGLGFLSHLGNSPPSLPFHQSAHRKEKEKLTSIESEPGQPHALTFSRAFKKGNHSVYRFDQA